MIITGIEREREIEKLNLTHSLIKLCRGEFVHDDLEFRCETLRYSLEPEDFSPKNLNVIPLWEGESSITGFYLEEENPIFITYHIDDSDSFQKIGENVKELIDYLVSEYGEDETELHRVLSN